MSIHTEIILAEVRAELRNAQVAHGYDAQHDDMLTEGELLAVASGRMLDSNNEWQTNRRKLIEAAGLIVSEIARLDRKAKQR